MNIEWFSPKDKKAIEALYKQFEANKKPTKLTKKQTQLLTECFAQDMDKEFAVHLGDLPDDKIPAAMKQLNATIKKVSAWIKSNEVFNATITIDMCGVYVSGIQKMSDAKLINLAHADWKMNNDTLEQLKQRITKLKTELDKKSKPKGKAK